MTTRLPDFEQPMSFLRFFGPRLDFPNLRVREGATLQFMRLLEAEGPLQGQHRFEDVSPGERSGRQNFTDLEMDDGHIAQVFIGVSPGGQLRVFHPNDLRVLDWDENTPEQFNEDDTGILEHVDSPIERPSFEFWVAGGTENFTPAFDVRNALVDVVPRRSIDIEVVFLATKYTFDFIDPRSERDLFQKLERGIIASHHADFGGGIGGAT